MSVIARFALREAVRRRVFAVVALLTAAFLVLYALGVWQAFGISDEVGFRGVDGDTVVGATMFGLAMFGTLFLGVVLAVFLTLGAIRGDAERGLLQPVLVRPVTRRDVLLARLLAAGGVSAGYVLAVYLGAMLITGAIGGWWPGDAVMPALALMLGVVVITALSLGGSVVLASTANGIAVFMAFGAGLVAGLLGQIGDALNSHTLETVADVTSYALPFEALYQAGLAKLTAGETGFNRFVLELGPLGGAQSAGLGLWLWSLAYLGGVVALALAAFRRLDL
jgi:ABC-2 type transport system permease protein